MKIYVSKLPYHISTLSNSVPTLKCNFVPVGHSFPRNFSTVYNNFSFFNKFTISQPTDKLIVELSIGISEFSPLPAALFPIPVVFSCNPQLSHDFIPVLKHEMTLTM